MFDFLEMTIRIFPFYKHIAPSYNEVVKLMKKEGVV